MKEVTVGFSEGRNRSDSKSVKPGAIADLDVEEGGLRMERR